MHKGPMKIQRRMLPMITVCFLLAVLVVTMVVVFKPAYAALPTDISSQYNWKPLKIGGGGFVTGMVIHPTAPGVMYTRTDVGGAYRWDAATQTWKQIVLASSLPGPQTTDYAVDSIAVSPKNSSVVYMAVGNDIFDTTKATGRILKSINSGKTWTDSGYRWTNVGNGDYRQGSERLAVDPNNNNVVYFGSRTQGLWVSTNAGLRWQQIVPTMIPLGSNTGTPVGVKFVQFDPTSRLINGKTSRIYVGVAGQGIYRTDDAGKTWIRILATPDIPYEGELGKDGGFYLSIASNTGAGSIKKYSVDDNTWTTITPPGWESCYALTIDPFHAHKIFVASCGLRNDHFWRSVNDGTNWDVLKIAITSSNIPWITRTDETNWMSVGRLVFDPLTPDRLWFAQGTGVWLASNLNDTTITWDFKTTGIEEMVANDLIVPPGGRPLTAFQDRKGFYHANPDAYPQEPLIDKEFNDATSLDYSGNHPNFVVVASSDTRWLNPTESAYSTDGGQTWTKFSGMHDYSDLYGGNIAVSATDTNRIIWLPTNQGKPYITTDRGATWTKLTFFNDIWNLHQMIWWGWKKALDSDKVNGSFYIYSGQNGGEFYRSADGQTWEKAPGQAPSSTNNDAHVFGQVRAVPGQAGNVWVSTAQGGLAYTADAGNSWTQVAAVQHANAFGFGAPLGGSTYPTVYLYGKIADQWGVWRSRDKGENWEKLAQYPGNLADQVNVVNGDMNIPGRVYVGFSGNSFIYGTDKLAPKTPTPLVTPTATAAVTPTSLATPTPGVTPTPTPGVTATPATTPTPTSTPTGGSITLTPTADRDNYSSHDGSEGDLDISIYQTAYLKFDLSSAGGVNSAHLRVYRNLADLGNITITAYKVDDNTWTEASTTLPALGDVISSQSSTSVGYVDFDVTSYVQAVKASGNTVTIAINASCPSWQNILSRESSTNQPQLVIA